MPTTSPETAAPRPFPQVADTAAAQDVAAAGEKATPVATSEDARGSGLGLLGWTPILGAAVLAVALVRNGSGPITDPDTLWHLRAGQHLVQTWQFSGPDPFSDFSLLPWVYTQWIPEVLAAAANHVAGLAGVAWLAHLGRLLVLATLLVICRRQAAPLPAVLAAAAGFFATTGSLGARPQLAGLVFLGISVGAWLATERDGRVRWWLVPLTWVWAMSHGTWLLGFALGGLVVVGLALDRRVSLRQAARLALVPLLALVAAASTPVGPALLGSSFAVSAVSTYIQEWQSASITDAPVAAAMGMVLLLAACWAKGTVSISWTRLGLFAFALVSALLYARTVAVAGIVLAPLLAAALQTLVGASDRAASRIERMVVGGAFVLSLVAAALILPHTASGTGNVPHRLDRTLAALPRGTVVWNADALGGWLMWDHPNVSQTMDTRAEVYGPTYVDAYVRAMMGLPGWESTLDATHAGYALIGTDTALRSALAHERGWVDLGSDEGYTLLRSPSS